MRTVARYLSKLESDGLIKRGDQELVAHRPPNRRPIVYDLNVKNDPGATFAEVSASHLSQDVQNPEDSGGDKSGWQDTGGNFGRTRLAHNTSFNTSLENTDDAGVVDKTSQHQPSVLFPSSPPWEDGPAPSWADLEDELVESTLALIAKNDSVQPSMDSTTPDITGAKMLIRDGVEILAADPTLAPGVVLPTRNGWSPSPAALATAHSVVKLKDIPISIARYEIVKAEKREIPSSAEWLRWLLADEEKLKAEQAQTVVTTIRKRRWDSVAE